MAYPQKIIRNSKTGQDIRFIKVSADTNGALLEMESTYHSRSKEPVPHYHPFQKEDFTVVSGELTVTINGKKKTFGKGETLHIPANTAHSMWNNSNEATVVNWKVQPAMDTEYFLETATGIVNHHKTNDAGMPGILQISLMADRFNKVFRLAKPPFIFQQILFFILKPVALLSGYKSTYKEFID